VSTKPHRIVQIHDTAFVSARRNVLRMKTPLKYTRIRLASSFNCTLVVAPEDIFIASFFFAAVALSAFVGAEIQSESVFVRSEIQFATLFDRDVAVPRADVAQLCYRLLLSPR